MNNEQRDTLHASRDTLHASRDTLHASHFTLHEMRAQKLLFMQNEPKFKKARTNISTVLTKDYDNWTLGERGKNEPKTNPNKAKRTQTKPISNPAPMLPWIFVSTIYGILPSLPK